MSLINDALKRAKETHQQNPRPTTTPDAPKLVTAPSQQRSGVPGWIWVVVIVLLVGLGAFLIGQSMHKGGNPNSVEIVAARVSTEQPVTAPAKISNPMPASTTPATATVASSPAGSTALVDPSKGSVVPTIQTNLVDV